MRGWRPPDSPRPGCHLRGSPPHPSNIHTPPSPPPPPRVLAFIVYTQTPVLAAIVYTPTPTSVVAAIVYTLTPVLAAIVYTPTALSPEVLRASDAGRPPPRDAPRRRCLRGHGPAAERRIKPGGGGWAGARASARVGARADGRAAGRAVDERAGGSERSAARGGEPGPGPGRGRSGRGGLRAAGGGGGPGKGPLRRRRAMPCGRTGQGPGWRRCGSWLLLAVWAWRAQVAAAARPRNFVVFGDSLSDNGNGSNPVIQAHFHTQQVRRLPTRQPLSWSQRSG